MVNREARYTHGHADSVLRSHRWRTAENSAGYLLPRLRPGMRLLDVGCGPGTITIDLGELVAPGAVVGVDGSDSVLEQARAASTADNVRFAAGDAYSLDFEDGSFDVVHAHQLLQHLGDPVAALREMRRVCAPGGVVAVRDSDYAGFTWWPAEPALDRWLSIYRAAARGNGAEPDAGRRLLGWARRAGFAEVAGSSSTWCFATQPEREWWGSLWAERVRASALTEQLRGGGLDDEEIEEIADGWLRWSQDSDGWFSVLHGEVLASG